MSLYVLIKFQKGMIILWNTKREILKNVIVAFPKKLQCMGMGNET